eukprot:XP_013985929.1 PREDICTED: 85/88 kDa calcium-independent phospholipase A2-like [Salmo salar]
MDHMELIKALIVFGADVEMHNDLGETPGLIAARTSKGSNRKVLLDMLCSVGVQRCAPPSSPLNTHPSPKKAASSPGIGFEDIMHVAAAVGAMSRGREEVDGFKTGSRKIDRLLCLDGGGIKGLVLIQLLIALEKEAGRPIKELFDWVSGTSTGGILALAIIHGKDMEYLRCLYFRMKEQVFKGSRPYESAPLEDFLKKEFGENTMMTDVRHPRVSVLFGECVSGPAVFPSGGGMSVCVVVSGWEDEDVLIVGYTQEPAKKLRKVTDQEQVVWRAARSSGAAPTYFRPMGRFLDGGLLANNPTLDAMTEIHQYNKSLKAEGRGLEVQRLGVVVSLGTGKPPQVVVNSVDVFRPSNPLELAKSFVGAKELGKMLVDCCTDSDGCAVDRARSWCEMIDTVYHRLSPQLSQEVMLDEVSDAVLVDMLWETQMYLYEQRENVQLLAQQLLNGY